jgi:hypothetical protein
MVVLRLLTGPHVGADVAARLSLSTSRDPVAEKLDARYSPAHWAVNVDPLPSILLHATPAR